MSRSFLTNLKIPWADFQRLSVIVLILMNMVPIWGILLWDWKVFPILFLFWAENLIIGVYNVLKLLFWSPHNTNHWKTKARIIPFFCLHYGLFALVHGFLILIIFGGLFVTDNPFIDFSDIVDTLKNQESVWAMLISTAGKIVIALTNYITSSVFNIWINLQVSWGVIALVVSHGASLFTNYFGKGEYKRGNLNQLMMQPYDRVIILHIVIMIGGFLVMLMGAQVIGLILLVALKTYADLKAHLRQHSYLAVENTNVAGLSA
jgi:hypothetical protein